MSISTRWEEDRFTLPARSLQRFSMKDSLLRSSINRMAHDVLELRGIPPTATLVFFYLFIAGAVYSFELVLPTFYHGN